METFLSLAASSNLSSGWAPSTFFAFHILFIFRLISSFYNNINDCDETYNYWEPAHFLMHGTGFQTWEYSPAYAIRSYAYILLNVLPLILFGTINKIVQFYALRVSLVIVCTICETYFYSAIKKMFGCKVAFLTLIFLVPSNGMFIASSAFLPSSFTMYCGLVAMAAWFNGREEISILATAIGAIVGWPFAAALGIPIAFDIIFCQRRVLFFLFWCLLSFIITAVPTIYIDSRFYGKFVFSSLNIILYNVFGKGGPELYGTEPWTYYFANSFLNFNIVFLFALMSWILIEYEVLFGSESEKSRGTLWRRAVSPMVIWIAIFFTRPHKEERFLFPIYPLICLSGAIGVLILQELFIKVSRLVKFGNVFHCIIKWTPLLVGLVHALLGISRALALYNGYHSSLQLYRDINSQQVLSFTGYMREINVCVGKEWYRFGSSYFLPDKRILPLRARWHLKFIQSDFKGQLPKPYSSHPNATSIIPTHMNDMNKEEPSRYFDVNKCHFLVDLDVPSLSPMEPQYSKNRDQWDLILSYPFLDSNKLSSLSRAFYIPTISKWDQYYIRYVLLRNKKANFIKDPYKIPEPTEEQAS